MLSNILTPGKARAAVYATLRLCRHRGAAKSSAAGFTFIEAIVTAVIMGILAAVAIPVYTSYVDSQRKDTLKNIAQMTAASANIYARRTNSAADCGTTAACTALLGIFLSNPAQFDIKIVGNTVTVKDALHSSVPAQTATF